MRFTLAAVTASALVACTHAPTASLPSPTRAPVPNAGRTLSERPAAFLAGCQQDIQRARALLTQLQRQPTPREPLATLTTYDDALTLLNDAVTRATIGTNVHPDAAFRKAATECEQRAERELTDLSLDRSMHDVLASLDMSGQDEGARRWVALQLKDFRRSGVDRDEDTRQAVRVLQAALVRWGQEFVQHIREDTRTVLLSPEELDGLPEDYVRAHPPGPDGRVRVTTESADTIPVLTYSRSARAREAVWRAGLQRGYPTNVDTLKRLLTARHELATTLGYPHWAAYSTEPMMMRTPEAVADFIDRLAASTQEQARADAAALLAVKRLDTPEATRVDPWDERYLNDQVRARRYDFDSRTLLPYFEYTRVKQGVLELTSRLFGLSYRRVPDAPVWHPDVEAYDVYEGTERLGRFYLDMRERPDKYPGSAEWDMAAGRAGRSLPEAVLTFNFARAGSEPTLLRLGEVKAFLHEFGHLLHHVLGNHSRWAGLSSTYTERDFVEAPSQLLEEWLWRPESLRTFARHYQTGEPIPLPLIERMNQATGFGKGLWVRTQLFCTAFSLRLHERDPRDLDVVALEKQMQEKYTPFAYAEGTYFHLSFEHLEGYGATYYTYLWSLLLAKDLFTPFEQEGLMNPATALRYRRTVLAPGATRDAAALLHDFLGRDANDTAFLRWLDNG
ncbi:Zn-dependent oligopeptidase [Myxococcaceae bacterium JPH2]|nr:Zn-dependent oligopeptidase [Myxococcaceae bacterium JPH2]